MPPAFTSTPARIVAAAAITFAAALASAAPVAAHNSGVHAPGADGRIAADLARVLGPGARALPNGLYRVRPRVGPALRTHGPDSYAAAAGAPDAGEVGFDLGDAERPPVCASSYHQHVLYARPSSTPDGYQTYKPRFQQIVRRMNAVLNAESLASGGPSADYRVRCDATGGIAVDSFVSDGASFSKIVAAARKAGFASPLADYLIFYDGAAGSNCGFGSYLYDERPGAANQNNSGGGYAVAYAPCWFGPTPMHEVGHTMGAVQYGAPNSTGSGMHCSEANDVMCYAPDGGDKNQSGFADRCPGRARFDCNFDDYFDTAPEPGEYLASHWNLGSPLNRFIAFEGVVAPHAAAPSAHQRARRLSANGKRLAGATGAAGEWQRFSVRVPGDAKQLRVALTAGDGANLALYLRRRVAPTTGRFDCRRGVAAGHGDCRLDDPRPGAWIVGVLTRGGAAGVPFELRARVRH